MPIFQEDIDHQRPPAGQPHQPQQLMRGGHGPTLLLDARRFSEESLPVELCEGPIPDSPTQRPTTPENQNCSHGVDRSALIERLKRRESPSWIPTRHVRANQRHDHVSLLANKDEQVDSISISNKSPTSPPQKASESPNLLPSPQISPEKGRSISPIPDRLKDGLGIERPRSALHSGDFTAEDSSQNESPQRPARHRQDHLSVDMTWMSTSPPRTSMPTFQFDRRGPFAEPGSSFKSTASPLSSSFSSSFAYQPPTSPLAQSITNEDEDGFTTAFRAGGFLADRMEMPRASFEDVSPFSSPLGAYRGQGCSSFRREATFPYQAHQPRRSSGSGMGMLNPGPSPQRPTARSRRPSLGGDSSPSQHASMVGPYEESILHGRMSTTPSKPFDFMAQIGVLGKGKCKSRLRCPPHVTLHFPAVFYSYNNAGTGRSQTNDGPSPYVGQIDLENGLPNPTAEANRRRARRQQSESADIDLDMLIDGPPQPAGFDQENSSAPLKAPPGGSYRIPEKGQIQIVVKNQNKTAVKLFLVPYDLNGMPPGTKTFIRQRSYSHGPIIDNLPNLSASAAAVAMGRPTLRYLVHLHICSPSKGRFYLYKSIRIVFANRVPEGKEKLRNETSWPEPRFSPYKPILQMHPPITSSPLHATHRSGGGAMLAADKAFRRRSLGIPAAAPTEAAHHRSPFSASALGSLNPPQRRLSTGPRMGYAAGGGNTLPVEPVPFRFPAHQDSDEGSDSAGSGPIIAMVVDDESGPPHSPSRPSTKDSTIHGAGGGTSWAFSSPPQYEKLSKGDAGYGGNAFAAADARGGRSGSPLGGGGGEGLLSQSLRSLGVEQAKLYNLPPP